LRTDPYEKMNLLNNSLDAEAIMAKELLEAELLLIRN
jgi:hypothetical protein